MEKILIVTHIPDCDLCALQGMKTPAAVDGKLKSGQWANMCLSHFGELGVGLGTGRGQKLVLAPAIEGAASTGRSGL